MLCELVVYPIIIFLCVILLVKIIITFKTRWNNSYTCLAGKTVIITGANAVVAYQGLNDKNCCFKATFRQHLFGYATALDLAKRGARIILACRNAERAEAARTSIISATGNKNVVVKLLDLSSLKSVRDFCEDFNANEDKLDILINNAAAGGLGDKFTEDGLQIGWQTNHLSPFLLTHLLFGKLKSTPHSRVVVLTSQVAQHANLTPSSVNVYPAKSINLIEELNLYALTKAANILFTIELAKRINSLTPTVNAVHPGAVSTEFLNKLPPFLYAIGKRFLNCIYKTAEAGAQTVIYCAVSKDLATVSGQVFEECHPIEMYKNCKDIYLSTQVWEICETLVKLKESEKISPES